MNYLFAASKLLHSEKICSAPTLEKIDSLICKAQLPESVDTVAWKRFSDSDCLTMITQRACANVANEEFIEDISDLLGKVVQWTKDSYKMVVETSFLPIASAGTGEAPVWLEYYKYCQSRLSNAINCALQIRTDAEKWKQTYGAILHAYSTKQQCAFTEKIQNLEEEVQTAPSDVAMFTFVLGKIREMIGQTEEEPENEGNAEVNIALGLGLEGEWLGVWEKCQLLSRTKQAGCTVKILSDGMVCTNVPPRFVRRAAVPQKMEDGCATSMLTNKNVGFQDTFFESSSGEETASDEEAVANVIGPTQKIPSHAPRGYHVMDIPRDGHCLFLACIEAFVSRTSSADAFAAEPGGKKKESQG